MKKEIKLVPKKLRKNLRKQTYIIFLELYI